MDQFHVGMVIWIYRYFISYSILVSFVFVLNYVGVPISISVPLQTGKRGRKISI